MPFMILVGFLLFGGLGWFFTHPKCDCMHQKKGAAGEAIEVSLVDEPPLTPWQAECRSRLQQAEHYMVRVGAQIDQRNGQRNAAGNTATEDFFRKYEIRVSDTPGGGDGVYLKIEGPDGERYGAGVSGVQPGVVDADWYSLNKGAETDEKRSYWQDFEGRSAFVAAVDPKHPERLEMFTSVMKAAADDCLAHRRVPPLVTPESTVAGSSGSLCSDVVE